MHSWRIFGQVQSGYNIGGGGGEKLGGGANAQAEPIVTTKAARQLKGFPVGFGPPISFQTSAG